MFMERGKNLHALQHDDIIWVKGTESWLNQITAALERLLESGIFCRCARVDYCDTSTDARLRFDSAVSHDWG